MTTSIDIILEIVVSITVPLFRLDDGRAKSPLNPSKSLQLEKTFNYSAWECIIIHIITTHTRTTIFLLSSFRRFFRKRIVIVVIVVVVFIDIQKVLINTHISNWPWGVGASVMVGYWAARRITSSKCCLGMSCRRVSFKSMWAALEVSWPGVGCPAGTCLGWVLLV